MSLRSKIVDFLVGGAIAKIQARYEAAFFSASRSYLPAYIQGARDDINSLSRSEVLRRCRYFEKNSNTVIKALTVLSVNVIGTGINPTPATANADWNNSSLAWWKAWSGAADITGTASIPEMQDIAFRSQNVDGDFGIELCLNEFDRPALNLIEGHRITSAGIDIKALEAQGYKISDGVVYAKAGKPLAYCVANEFDGGVSVIEASKFILFYTKKRAGQLRGISRFHSGVVTINDLDDLQKFEMLAAKDAASKSTVVQTAAGAVASGDGRLIGGSQNVPTATDPIIKAEYYKKIIGGEYLYTYPGDKIEQYRSDRPSAATSGFWDKLENSFAQGSELSYAALVDYRGNWGGATLRAAVTGDNRLFSLRTTEQAAKWQRVWEYAIGWAMDHGELARNPDFKNVRWHPPRRTTVDIGNESSAMLNELRAGLRTYEGSYGEAGDDWKERLEQRAEEEDFINKLAAKYKMPRQLIASFAQERITETLAAPPAAKGGAGSSVSQNEPPEMP